MPMTITEKILAAHAGRESVSPGELVMAKVDIALGNDITAPIAINEFEKAGAKKVFDKDRVILVPDHFCPTKDIASAMQVQKVRDFATRQNLTHWYEGGESGVEHALLPEKGLVVPGDVVIGADSHTCTYGAMGAFATGVGSTDLAFAMATGEVWLRVPESIKFVYEGKLNPWVEGKDLILYTIGDIGVDGALYQAMEFTGPVIEGLSMSQRLTMSNMAIEAGAKCGMIAPDKVTEEYVTGRALRPWTFYASDPDAVYAKTVVYDVSKIEPQVAFPHLPENTRPVSEAGNVPIHQVVIGSCTNGRIEDMRMAASVLKGRKADKNVRLIVIPATPWIYRKAMEEGLFTIFLDAGAVISPPTCGPCLGGHMGILAKGERAVATTNRNFVGRMGHQESEVYLTNPAVAAASAVLGRVAHPGEL
ncbi:MAG: 3-isopropylmalate dehydratase large subunit [Deltaproteobacteria bacterium]|nr:3-isopropylmalate dehydratase large subunit [Deltaproteobacteria bacterium]